MKIKRVLSVLLSALFGVGIGLVFGFRGVIVLLVVLVIVLVYAEWQYRREKKILKERLNIIMAMTEETKLMIDKACSELDETRLNIS